jgi:hypothetical protein
VDAAAELVVVPAEAELVVVRLGAEGPFNA